MPGSRHTIPEDDDLALTNGDISGIIIYIR